MRLVLATNHLGLGGSESYLLTVAEQLDRLGHEVLLYAPERGSGFGAAAERGLAVVGEGELPDDACEAALVQDGGVAHQIADRYPDAPLVFVAHSESFDLQAPPQLPDAVAVVVALNDRVAARMRSFAVEVEVARLRQPIDTERFTPRAPLPAVARGALLLSNAPHGDRLAMLEEACGEVGLELARLGGRRGQKADIREALTDADVVIGYGRSILEAMACGRAAYVYDWNGWDGWMTADSYAEIEADGIAGRSGRGVADRELLVEDLRRYSSTMGPANHDLVISHHRANVHAQELVEIFRRHAEPVGREPLPRQEMARLVRLEWRARSDVHALSEENAHLRGLLVDAESARERAREELGVSRDETGRVRGEYEATLSWRVTRPLRWLLARLRRSRRG